MVYRFPAQRSADVSDATLLDEIKAQITELPTYGYRRACALVNRHRANTGAARVRAERFDTSSDKRAVDASAAHATVFSIANRFEFGQPHLVGQARSA